MSEAPIERRDVARPGSAARVIELDGTAGRACLLVVMGHYFGEVEHGFRFLRLEWIGVDLFFCLSGYLIGGILLDTCGTPANLATFYTRRAFRIFPIYYLVVTLVLLALLWFPQFRGAAYPPGLLFGYAQNFAMSFTGAETSKWLMPTWTLCVEEHHLLLPAILYLDAVAAAGARSYRSHRQRQSVPPRAGCGCGQCSGLAHAVARQLGPAVPWRARGVCAASARPLPV